MFKLDTKIKEKLLKLVNGYNPQLATVDAYVVNASMGCNPCSGSCGNNCSGSCAGSCRGNCSGSCQRYSR